MSTSFPEILSEKSGFPEIFKHFLVQNFDNTENLGQKIEDTFSKNR